MRASTILGAVLLAAVVLKTVVATQLGGHPLLQQTAGLDTAAYVDLARQVVAGNVLLGPGLYYVSPLYIYFLAAVYGLTDSFEAARHLQALLGVVTVGLVYVMGRLWADTRAGLMAAVFVAGSGVMAFYEGLLMQSALDGVLTAAALAALTAGLVGGPGASGRQSPRVIWFMCAGVAFGLLALNRPNALAPALIIPLVLAARKRWRVSGALCLGLVLVLAPVVGRNVVVSGQWALVSSQGGLNFYIGNNATATGFYQVVPGVRPEIEGQRVDTRIVAERAAGRPLTDAEVSKHFLDRGLAWVQAEPVAALRNFLFKVWLVFHADHSALPHSYEFFVTDAPTALKYLVLNPWLVVSLGLAGLVAGIGHGRRSDFLVWASFVPAYAVSVAVFFVSERYRVPLFVPMAVSAGVLMSRAYDEVTRKAPQSRRWITLAGGAVAAAALLVNWPITTADSRYGDRLRMISISADAGRTEETEAWVERASAVSTEPGHVHAIAGRALLSAGEASRAATHLARARDLGESDAELLMDLADVDIRSGRAEAAADTLASIRWTSGATADQYTRAGRLAAAAGRPPLALDFFERAVAQQPDGAEAWAQLGITRLVVGQWEGAGKALQAALTLNPVDATVLAGLGWVAVSQGDIAVAHSRVREALAINPRDDLALRLLDQLQRLPSGK